MPYLYISNLIDLYMQQTAIDQVIFMQFGAATSIAPLSLLMGRLKFD